MLRYVMLFCFPCFFHKFQLIKLQNAIMRIFYSVCGADGTLVGGCAAHFIDIQVNIADISISVRVFDMSDANSVFGGTKRLTDFQKLQKQYDEFVKAPKYNLNSEEVYCVCRRPDNDGELMVACDGCDEWFHFKCMKLDKRNKDLVKSYYCKFCDILHDKGKSVWKKKCKLANCYRPIDAEGGKQTQFCSEEHGREYWMAFLGKFDDRKADTESISKSQVENVFQLVTSRSELKGLGDHFPIFDKGEMKISNEQKLQIATNDEKVDVLNKNVGVARLKIEYLLKMKEIQSQINELLTVHMDPDRKEEEEEDGDSSSTKKKKSKRSKKTKKFKIEICGFDNMLLLDDAHWAEFVVTEKHRRVVAFERFSPEEANKIVENYQKLKTFVDDHGDLTGFEFEKEDIFENICSMDKRKCQLHNGWYNIVKDGLDLKINETLYEIEQKRYDNEKLNKYIQLKNWKLYCE